MKIAPTPQVRRLVAAAAALVLLTAVAFSPVVHNGFVLLDDDRYITDNDVIQRGFTPEGLKLALTSSYAANWQPLTWVSHMLDVELFGLDPRGHHGVSLALHAAAAALLFLALQAMTGRSAPAFVAAALFAVHPLRVESVVWAAERKDVLSGMLFVAALLAWVRYARRPGPGRYGFAALVFTLGLLSKPMVVTLPLVLLLLDWWPLGRLIPKTAVSADPGARRRFLLIPVLEKVPLLALSLLCAVFTLHAQGVGGAIVAMETIAFPARVANAALSSVSYLAMAAVPLRLATDYPHAKPALLDAGVIVAALALAAASLCAVLLRRRQPWLLTGWVWYLVVLVPVIGLVQVGGQARADRYTYLPGIGVALALCWSLAALAVARPALRALVRAAAALAIAVCVPLTMRQVTFWRDSETLLTHTLSVSPNSWGTANNLGLHFERSGRREEALALYREAIRMKPDRVTHRRNLARLLAEEGRQDEALEELRAAVELSPEPLARLQLASKYERRGRDGEAIAQLRQLIRESPRFVEAYNNLAVLLTRRGEAGEARRLLGSALEIDPGYADARANLRALEAGAGPSAP